MGNRQNPPPPTVPSRHKLHVQKDNEVDLDLWAEVLGDLNGSDVGNSAETSFEPQGAIANGDGSVSLYRTPGYTSMTKGGVEKIVKLDGRVEIKGTINIRTTYPPGQRASDRSGYGRGTTPDDEKTGNTSLGFHESCHRTNFLDYLKRTALPRFQGKAGMTPADYQRAVDAFSAAMDAYFKAMEKQSAALTDEVGYKKSSFDLRGPRRL